MHMCSKIRLHDSPPVAPYVAPVMVSQRRALAVQRLQSFGDIHATLLALVRRIAASFLGLVWRLLSNLFQTMSGFPRSWEAVKGPTSAAEKDPYVRATGPTIDAVYMYI